MAGQERLGSAPALIALIQQGAMAQMACVAAELRLADLLADGPKHASELAQATGSHAPSLLRLLRALASLELCTEREDGSFALSPTGALLHTDAPNSLRSWALWFGRYHWPVWGHLLHSVKTGESARKLVTGTDGFVGLFERNPEAAALFNNTMLQLTRLVANEVVRAYDFAGMRRIVDVGGGHGALLATVLAEYPGLRGVILELPHAIEGASAYIQKAGLTSRCELIAGSFFETVPAGADAYLLKSIIHDWNDERSTLVLRNCRCAIPSTGRLLLIERVMPARLEPSSAHRAIAFADLAMLVGPGGQERTVDEYRALLESSGFRLAKVIATALEYCILDAVPY
jgi:hypothetical protein